MSINQNVLGLIFASINDSAVIDLTKLRTMVRSLTADVTAW